MSDNKTTVRLPKTSFSMKANLNKLEKEVLSKWEEIDIYSQIRSTYEGSPKFILHDGPPYANGNIHVGHALNKILKDIIVKSYTVLGYNAPFVPGWDCHGLPIEWKIEEKYKSKKIPKEDVDVNVFRKDCRDFASKWIDTQKDEFKTLGVIADYQNPYVTMDYNAEAKIVESSLNLLEEGVLYQGKRPIMWSCIEQTALAEAEIEYKDKKSDAIYVGFPVASVSEQYKNQTDLFNNAQAVIWTTTPWTLPANQGIAYGPEITYSLIEATIEDNKRKIIIASSSLDAILSELNITEHKELLSNINLENFVFKHCLSNKSEEYNFTVPSLKANFVEEGSGTGLVHMAPSHGEDDFYLCKSNNIEPKELLLDNGVYKDSVPLFAGQHIFKVNPLVIESLKEAQSLFAHNIIEHSYPHSWRSKAPLIYRLTSQWFISLEKNDNRKKALDLLETIQFVPEKSKNRLKTMLENRPDWCVSRQRVWGVPIGIFIHKETSNPVVDREVFNNIVSAFKKEGSDAWFKECPKRFLTDKYNKEDYKAVNDVLDVWLDSGLTHNFVVQEREDLQFPADLYIEGSDQHRGWFQSSLVMSLLLNGKAPFKRLATHGYVLNSKKEKMSKSSGETLSPEKIVNESGAEILRLWAATVNYTEDVAIGKDIIAQQTESYRKVRNTLRYLIANLNYYSTSLEYKELESIDQYILSKIYSIDSLFEKTMKNDLSIHNFYITLLTFMQVDLSSFYFDIKKDILYCDKESSSEFLSTLTVFNTLFDFLCKWLAPVLSFTIEEAFSKRYNVEMGKLFLNKFAQADASFYNESLEQKWEKISNLRRVVTGCLEIERAKKVIGSSLEAAPVVYLTEENLKLLQEVNFADICITSNIIFKPITEEAEGAYKIASIEGISAVFNKVEGVKCTRCWKFYNTVSDNNLCNRCEDAVNEYEK